jgi:hypothetical protein
VREFRCEIQFKLRSRRALLSDGFRLAVVCVYAIVALRKIRVWDFFMPRTSVGRNENIMVQCAAAAATVLAVLASSPTKADAAPPAPEEIYSHLIPVKLWGVTQLRTCVFAVVSPNPDKTVTGTVSLAGDVEFKFPDGRSLFVRSDEGGPPGMAAEMVKRSCFDRSDI